MNYDKNFKNRQFEVCFLWCWHADVIQEDSGNYTCEIRGPHSAILAQVTHYLFVRGMWIVIQKKPPLFGNTE